MHFDGKMSGFNLKIINRVSIFQDFYKLFIINRVRASRSGQHPPYPNLGQVPPPQEKEISWSKNQQKKGTDHLFTSQGKAGVSKNNVQ